MNTPTRAFDFIYSQLENYPLKDSLCQKKGGSWLKYSTQDVVDLSNRLSLALMDQGLKPGDKVAIISSNRPEWNFVDLACQQVGVITVPMYTNITVEDYKYIFEHAEVSAVFVEGGELAEKVLAAIPKGLNEHVYTFDEVDRLSLWDSLIEDVSLDGIDRITTISDTIVSEDLMTIIYTSGTTGRPKGVMLSHENVVSNTIGAYNVLKPCYEFGKDRVLSFLPLCHIYERTGLYFYMYSGMAVYYAESLEKIAENIKEVGPNGFNCVPRLLEKIYDKIVTKGHELPSTKKKLFFWALNLGLKYNPEKDFGFWYNFQLKIANKLIFSKWREALGGHVKVISSGAAALQPRLARVFWAAQIPICEGYGLTETSPIISLNAAREGHVRMGSVGRILDGVEVKIANDGEVLCKGPNVMMGYYKSEEQTAEVLKDGWFHTGDIGEVKDGFLKITDRKKEMFKTSGGKYIAPQVIENIFKESEFIEQLMVVGEGKKFPAALIVPNEEVLKPWCESRSIDWDQRMDNEEVLQHYHEIVARFNESLGHWEQIKKIELLGQLWGVDTGELTATLKLKRRVIKEKYAAQIEKIYDC